MGKEINAILGAQTILIWTYVDIYILRLIDNWLSLISIFFLWKKKKYDYFSDDNIFFLDKVV